MRVAELRTGDVDQPAVRRAVAEGCDLGEARLLHAVEVPVGDKEYEQPEQGVQVLAQRQCGQCDQEGAEESVWYTLPFDDQAEDDLGKIAVPPTRSASIIAFGAVALTAMIFGFLLGLLF